MLTLIKKQKKHHADSIGFTLIEIMLVILVVALMTLYAVRIINQSLANSMVNRAASQMISIEQAVLAYYALNGTPTPSALATPWPSSLTALTQSGAAPNNPSVTIQPLLPATALCSPFATPDSSTSCGYYASYSGAPAPNSNIYYVLSITTPSNALAQKLLAALPNSWITTNTTVNMPVPVPADISNTQNHGWIVSAGVVSTLAIQDSNSDNSVAPPGAQIYLPNCPPQYEGHIIFAPERYQTDAVGKDWGLHLAQTTNSGNKFDNQTPTGFVNGYPNYITTNSYLSIVFNTGAQDSHGNDVFATTTADSPDGSRSSMMHLIFYMTFCLPAFADNNGNYHWGTHWINAEWKQDAQCSTSWQDYLNHSGDSVCNSTDSNTWNISPPVGSAAAD